MKNLSSSPYPAWNETPRTNIVVEELQSRIIPFDKAFWRLLELTQVLEVENTKLKKARLGKKRAAAKKRREGVVAKRSRSC